MYKAGGNSARRGLTTKWLWRFELGEVEVGADAKAERVAMMRVGRDVGLSRRKTQEEERGLRDRLPSFLPRQPWHAVRWNGRQRLWASSCPLLPVKHRENERGQKKVKARERERCRGSGNYALRGKWGISENEGGESVRFAISQTHKIKRSYEPGFHRARALGICVMRE